MRPRSILFAALLVLTTIPAQATGEIESLITEADRKRLADYEQTRQAAVDEARASAPAGEMAILDGILARKHEAFAGFDLTGDWQCRVTKVGGLATLVTYDWFRCRVTDDGSGWMLEKLSGSQRTKGRFFDDGETRLTYLGSGYIAGDAAPAYGTGPDSDQAGYAFRTGPRQWHIEFPAPRYESKLDILELRR